MNYFYQSHIKLEKSKSKMKEDSKFCLTSVVFDSPRKGDLRRKRIHATGDGHHTLALHVIVLLLISAAHWGN